MDAMARDVSIVTDNSMINELLSTGGMNGMLNTVWLILCAMCFGGSMEASGFLNKLSTSFMKMATNIVYNAKLRNTSICGATETILIHEKIVKKFCNPILKKLEDENCKIYGDNILKRYYKGKLYPAKEKDWSTEYLTSTVSVKIVKNCKAAINHINKYGTMHTDAIITKNKKTAQQFLKNVKSSIAMHNTSTQFADGGEFGFGGEVGISTNTLPPRGPVGLEQLVSYKYEISSKGKIRD